MSTQITIFGFAGVGKGTIGTALARKLGCEFKSIGELARKTASDLGISDKEFEERAKTDPAMDRALDDELVRYGRETPAYVLDARLGWYFVPTSFKVMLTCEWWIRVDRVANRDRLTYRQAETATRHRENSIRKRFKDQYGVKDLGNAKHFDLVIDTTRSQPDRYVDEIAAAVRALSARTVTSSPTA